jgi:hypothetical protein
MDSKKKSLKKVDSDEDSSSDNESVSNVEYEQVDITNIKSELVFFIDFHDGYAFRQIMEFLKLTVTSVPMYFTENGISILQGNGDGSLVVNINIKGHELLTYHFNSSIANHAKEAEPYHVVCFNVSKFRDTIKSTARKEGIRIFQYANNPIVHIQVYGGNKNGEGGTSIETQNYTPMQYDLSGFDQSIYAPNCRSPLSEFCNSCGQFGKVKSTKYTNFACYPKGVKVTACSETGVISMFKKWGECEDSKSAHSWMTKSGGGGIASLLPKPEEHKSSKSKALNVKIPIDTVKALSKLSNLTNNGIIRIYCETEKIIRFMVSVSYYAELTIFWKEGENSEE